MVLALHRRVPQALTSLPNSLVSQLGAEFERYDQVCDVIHERLVSSVKIRILELLLTP